MSTDIRQASLRVRLAARRPTGWAAVAAATAVVLLIVLAARANPLVVLMHSNADLASPLVIGEEAHRYHDAQIATGRLGWWGGLWFLQAIRPLPGNSYLGSYLPMAITVLVAALLALQAGRLWGRLAPWIVLLVALGVGAEAWANFAAWSSRAPSWWAMGFVGVVAVAAARPGRSRRGNVALAIAAILASVFTAVVASGDQEATIALVPLAACGLYLLRVRRVRLGVALLGAATVTLLASRIVATIAENAGYLRQSFPVSLVKFDAAGDAFVNTLLGLQDVWWGPRVTEGALPTFSTNVGAAAGYLGMAMALAALVGVVVAASRAWLGRAPVADASVPPDTLASGDTRALPVDGDLDVQRGLWVTFWAVALLVYILAFGLTTAGGPLGGPVVRYLYGVPMAAAAAAAPLAARRRPWALACGAVLLGVVTVVGLVAQRPAPDPRTDASHSSVFRQIGVLAQAEGVTRGYAGYWSAYPLVLQSGFQLDVTPVGRCSQSAGLCTMYLHYIDQAYVPRPRTRSFLVIDASPVAMKQFPHAVVTELPKTLNPSKVVPVGDGVSLAFFDHDIASEIEPNKALGDPRVGKGGPLEPQ